MDVENGQEVRPHHYIRSVLTEGPVGANGRLKSGDELLEVRLSTLLISHESHRCMFPSQTHCGFSHTFQLAV